MLKWNIVPRNAVEESVAVVGGVNELAEALKLSRQSVYGWLELGYVPTRDKARALSALLIKKGHPISAARLMALDDAGDTEQAGDGARKRKEASTMQLRVSN